MRSGRSLHDLMFPDDILRESRGPVEESLVTWRYALERRGMEVRRNKTESLCVNEREMGGKVELLGIETVKVRGYSEGRKTCRGLVRRLRVGSRWSAAETSKGSSQKIFYSFKNIEESR